MRNLDSLLLLITEVVAIRLLLVSFRCSDDAKIFYLVLYTFRISFLINPEKLVICGGRPCIVLDLRLDALLQKIAKKEACL
jgi:hypothetical protein